MSYIAAEVRAEMARQKYGPTRLASETSLTRPRLHRRLSGEVPFNTDELGAVARALGVPASDLIARAESRAESAA